MNRRVIALVAAAVAVAASAACGSGEPENAVDEESGWAIDTIIQQAQAVASTSDEQLAILEEAQETGEISFEVYSEAIDRALRCIREEGGVRRMRESTNMRVCCSVATPLGRRRRKRTRLSSWQG
jgi:hypothetical protein